MTNYNSVASADIRQYVWQSIQDAGILDPNNYYVDNMPEGLIPIIPAQQVPEFNNLLPGKTYMYYDFEVKTIPVQWWMIDESMTITTVSQNYETVNQINNLILDIFRRYDESAGDINSFLAENGGSDFKYHHTLIDNVRSPEPFETEGDYQYGSVTFSYSYSRDTGANGRF